MNIFLNYLVTYEMVVSGRWMLEVARESLVAAAYMSEVTLIIVIIIIFTFAKTIELVATIARLSAPVDHITGIFLKI